MLRRPQTDEELLRRVARGDRHAFDELHRRTAPWLAVRLRRRCGDPGIVAEVLQETYLTAWRAAGSYRTGGSAAGWLWTVASRHLIDAFRLRARQADPPAALAGAPTASAEDEALGPELDDALARALTELSPELHDVLQATVLDGLTVRETAVLLGIPEGTVKTRGRRARLHLRGALS